MTNNIKFTVKEVAEYIGCSESSIRKLVKEKKIPYYKIYAKILFDKIAIDKWVYDNQIYQIENDNSELDVKTYE